MTAFQIQSFLITMATIDSDSNNRSPEFVKDVQQQLMKHSMQNSHCNLQCKCKVCSVQSKDLNWFTKHVAKHKKNVSEEDHHDDIKEPDTGFHVEKKSLPDVNSDNKKIKEENLACCDPIAIKDRDENPWAVEDASVFLKYCCPECDFNHLDFTQ